MIRVLLGRFAIVSFLILGVTAAGCGSTGAKGGSGVGGASGTKGAAGTTGTAGTAGTAGATGGDASAGNDGGAGNPDAAGQAGSTGDGGSTTNDGGSDGPSGDAVVRTTRADEFQALGAINAKVAQLDSMNLSAADEGAQIVTFALTQSAVASATADSNAVAIVLKNGRQLTVDLSWSTLANFTAADAPEAAAKITSRDLVIPKGPKALLMVLAGLPGGASSFASKLSGWLSDAGYSPQTVDASLENYKSALAGQGILYITTHGSLLDKDGHTAGRNADGSIKVDDQGEVKLAASNPVTDENDKPIQAYPYIQGVNVYPDVSGPSDWTTSQSNNRWEEDMQDGTLQYMTVIGFDENNRPRRQVLYAITSHWVEKYMTAKLSEDALIYIDACMSGATSFIAGAFQSGDTLSRYAGWSDYTPVRQVWNVSALVWDRLLAAGAVSPPSPAQRPFDLDGVYNALKSQGKTTAHGDTHLGNTSADLVLMGPSPVIVRPSIASLHQNPIGDTLTIDGLFGNKPGKVTVGGQAITCGAWPTDSSTPLDHCMVPADAYGDVVIDVDGVKSPVRELSHWKPTLEYKQEGPGGFFTDIKMHLDFRGDVLKFRDKPEQDPNDQKSWTAFLADEKKITCEIAFSGSYQGCTQSGGQTSAYAPSSTSPCNVIVSYDPSNTALPLRFQVSVVLAGGAMTCEGQSQPLSAGVQAIPGLTDVTGQAIFGAAIDPSTGVIKARTVSTNVGGVITYTMKWDDTTADAPPTDDDAR